MFWLGMLAGGIIGGTLGVIVICMLIIGKEEDCCEYSNECSIK